MPRLPGPRLSVLVSGIGLCVDYYDLTVINLVRGVLQAQYPVSNWEGSWQRSLVTASSFIGAVVGQLLLGALADRLGRSRLLVASGGLTFLGSLSSACALDWGHSHVGLWATLVFSRFVLGVGVGGEYPLSAAHASEHATAGSSGRRLCYVFSFLLLGSVLSSVVVLLCQVTGASGEFTWRFAFAFGAALSLASLWLRLRYAQDSDAFKRIQDVRARLSSDLASPLLADAALEEAEYVASVLPMRTTATLRLYWRPLVGTAGCWLLYDVVDYGFGLYSDDLLAGLHLGKLLGSNEQVGTTAGVLLVNLLALPGGLVAAWLLPRLGRKRTLQAGTAGMALCYISIAAGGAKLPAAVQLLLLAASNVFDNLGPGAMTYLIPGEIFPVAVRATCHGISAAAGKVGAALAGAGFGPLLSAVGLRPTCVVCATICCALLAHSQHFLPNYGVRELSQMEGAKGRGPAEALRLLYGGEEEGNEAEGDS